MAKAYIYDADFLCEECGNAMRELIIQKGEAPEDIENERTYDSSQFPKVADTEEESDSPCHCCRGENCLNAVEIGGKKYGMFFGNSLTVDGVKDLNDLIEDAPDNEVVQFWADFYSKRYFTVKAIETT